MSRRREAKKKSPRPPSASPDGRAVPPKPTAALVICRLGRDGGFPDSSLLCQAVDRSLRLAGFPSVRWTLLELPRPPSADGSACRLSLRDLIADQLECLASGAAVSGLALIGGGGEAVAGLLMGAARLNLPALLVPTQSAPDRVALLAEALGLCLPLSSTVQAGSPEQMRLAEEAGRRLAELLRQSLPLRRTLLMNAFQNAARIDAALGGSAESAVFLLALAREAGLSMELSALVDSARGVAQVCRLSDSGQGLAEFHAAGGIPAVFSALKTVWQPHPTMSGRGVNELARSAVVKNPGVIRVRAPYKSDGRLTLLGGNLAPHGALLSGGAPKSKNARVFSGAARVFDSREQALAALAERKIKPGEVCVVRYEGAKGPAGFRSISAVARELARQGLAGRVALVTDGCCGDTPELLSAELVSPEAMDGSPLAAVKDGDRIDLDPAARDLKINLTDTDLKIRLVRWQPPVMRPRTSFWSRYARAVGPVLQGACQS